MARNLASLGYAVLCDLAITDRVGKNSLVGIFDRINVVGGFPATHGRCFFGIEVHGIPGAHELRVLVRDDEGKDILPAIGPVKLQLSPQFGGGTALIEFAHLKLPRAGQYHLLVELDGVVLGERLLHVVETARPGEGERRG